MHRLKAVGERMVRPHDYIRSVLCLRVHPALYGQHPPVRRIQKISGQCRGSDIKGSKAECSFFRADIQDLPVGVGDIPDSALPAPFIKRRSQFGIRPESFRSFCSGF